MKKKFLWFGYEQKGTRIVLLHLDWVIIVSMVNEGLMLRIWVMFYWKFYLSIQKIFYIFAHLSLMLDEVSTLIPTNFTDRFTCTHKQIIFESNFFCNIINEKWRIKKKFFIWNLRQIFVLWKPDIFCWIDRKVSWVPLDNQCYLNMKWNFPRYCWKMTLSSPIVEL